MKTKDFQKLKNSEIADLKKAVLELKIKRDKALADISAGKESNLKKAKNLKKEIAQHLTIISEKIKK